MVASINIRNGSYVYREEFVYIYFRNVYIYIRILYMYIKNSLYKHIFFIMTSHKYKKICTYLIWSVHTLFLVYMFSVNFGLVCFVLFCVADYYRNIKFSVESNYCVPGRLQPYQWLRTNHKPFASTK